jgi:hypothetical protein
VQTFRLDENIRSANLKTSLAVGIAEDSGPLPKESYACYADTGEEEPQSTGLSCLKTFHLDENLRSANLKTSLAVGIAEDSVTVPKDSYACYADTGEEEPESAGLSCLKTFRLDGNLRSANLKTSLAVGIAGDSILLPTKDYACYADTGEEEPQSAGLSCLKEINKQIITSLIKTLKKQIEERKPAFHTMRNII